MSFFIFWQIVYYFRNWIISRTPIFTLNHIEGYPDKVQGSEFATDIDSDTRLCLFDPGAMLLNLIEGQKVKNEVTWNFDRNIYIFIRLVLED